MPEKASLQVAFLGLAERATHVREGETNILKWNVLGLKNILLVNFFPFGLNSWSLSLAMRLSAAPQSLKFGFKDESGEEIGWFNLQSVPETGSVPLTGTTAPFLQHLPQAWTIVFLLLPEQPAILVQKSGRYFVVLKADEENEEIIGEFYCHLVEPAPLTPEREAAIKSNPNLASASFPTMLRMPNSA